MRLPAVALIAALATTLTACGGGSAPDGAAKQQISRDALGIVSACGPSKPDELAIEQHVDHLLAAADKAGGASFTLGKFHSMHDVLLNVADFMGSTRCAPAQARRLRDAAS